MTFLSLHVAEFTFSRAKNVIRIIEKSNDTLLQFAYPRQHVIQALESLKKKFNIQSHTNTRQLSVNDGFGPKDCKKYT